MLQTHQIIRHFFKCYSYNIFLLTELSRRERIFFYKVANVLLNSSLLNHLRWQLIADRNEWPYTIIRRFSFWARRYDTTEIEIIEK